MLLEHLKGKYCTRETRLNRDHANAHYHARERIGHNDLIDTISNRTYDVSVLFGQNHCCNPPWHKEYRCAGS